MKFRLTIALISAAITFASPTLATQIANPHHHCNACSLENIAGHSGSAHTAAAPSMLYSAPSKALPDD